MTQSKAMRRAALALVVALAVAACSTAGATRPITQAPPPSSSTRPTTVPPAPTTTTDPAAAERKAILDVYNASWSASLALAADPKGNPDDPTLAQSTGDPLLTVLRRNLDGLRRHKLIESGPYSLHPTILSLTPSSASIEDCLYDQTDQVDVVTGTHTPPIYPHVLYAATITLTSAGWRVTDRYQKANTCTA